MSLHIYRVSNVLFILMKRDSDSLIGIERGSKRLAETKFQINSSIGTYNEDWQDIGFHHNKTLEIEIVIEGRGVFEWEERTTFVEAGHVIIIPPDIPHRFAAETKFRLGVIHLQGMPPALTAVAEKLAQGNGSHEFMPYPGLTKIDSRSYSASGFSCSPLR